MNRAILCASGIAALLLAACGGREAHPVSRYQPGDEDRSCQGLAMEVGNNEDEMVRLAPYEDATGKNVALGVTGAFLIVPWFFMDFKEGEAVELKALQQRNQWLREVAADKGCEVPPPKVLFEEKPAQEKKRRKSCC